MKCRTEENIGCVNDFVIRESLHLELNNGDHDNIIMWTPVQFKRLTDVPAEPVSQDTNQ